MIIPTGMRYTATVTGSVWKPVTCEGCGEQFAYKLTRKISGTGRSPLFLDNSGAQERARQNAHSGLDRALEAASAPVPCPRCQRFHSSMFGTLAGKRYEGLLALGIVSIIVGVVTAVLFVGFALIALGIGLLIWRSRLKQAYDPNADLERATKAAKPLPPLMLRSEYEAVIAEATAKGMDRAQLQTISWSGKGKPSKLGDVPNPSPAPAATKAAAPVATSGDGTGYLVGGIVLLFLAAVPMIGSLVLVAMPQTSANPAYGGVCGAVNLLIFGLPAGFCFRAWAKRRHGRSPNWLIWTPALLAVLLPAIGGVRYALMSPEQKAAIAAKEKESETKDAETANHPASKAPLANVETNLDGEEAPHLDFSILRVSEHQKPTQKAPWHAAGGGWTFLECATNGDAPARFTVGLFSREAGDSPVAFGKARLVFDDAAASNRFAARFAEAFHTHAPAARRGTAHDPLEMSIAILGRDLTCEEGGGCSSGEGGSWTATKWFPQRGELEAEVFFNYSAEEKSGEFSEKDSDYRKPLVAIFSGASAETAEK